MLENNLFYSPKSLSPALSPLSLGQLIQKNQLLQVYWQFGKWRLSHVISIVTFIVCSRLQTELTSIWQRAQHEGSLQSYSSDEQYRITGGLNGLFSQHFTRKEEFILTKKRRMTRMTTHKRPKYNSNTNSLKTWIFSCFFYTNCLGMHNNLATLLTKIKIIRFSKQF